MKSFLNFISNKQWVGFMLALVVCLVPTFSWAEPTLRVGFTINEPAVFRDAHGKPQGIYVDVLNYIAAQEGWTLEYQEHFWSDNLGKVQAGEIDLLLDIAMTSERAKLMRFSATALVEDHARVFVAPDLEVAGFADLSGKRVGLVRDDIHTKVFQQIVRFLGVKPTVVLTASSEISMDLLAAGKIDALVMPNLQSKVIRHRVTCVKTDIIFNPVELRFAAPLTADPAILARIDHHVTLLRQKPSSLYYKSMTKWVEGVGRIVIPKWLSSSWLIGGVSGFFVIIVLFNLLLRRQVKVQTRALEKSIAVQQKQESELGVARDIQLGLLPEPSFACGGYRLAAYLQPARMVGGDFFDFFKLTDQRLCFLIADVADKGIGAALFMAGAKTCLSVMAKDFKSVAKLMESVNYQLSENNPNCMFVTMFCGVIDLQTGLLTYTLAGHDPPYLQRKGGAVQVLDQAHCMALGLDEDAEYTQAAITLLPGDTLFMFTDGVSEAMNGTGQQFGEEAIRTVLADRVDLDCAGVVSAVKEAVEQHVGSTPAHDDITMLCLRREE